MSQVTVEQFKAYARIIHADDDDMIQEMIDAAEDECLRFTGRTELPTLPVDYPVEYDSNSSEIQEDVPSSGDPIAPSVRKAVLKLVQAEYEGKDEDEKGKVRRAVEVILFPYRTGLGG